MVILPKLTRMKQIGLVLAIISLVTITSAKSSMPAKRLPPLSKAELSHILGWVQSPGSNLCNGYYVEPLLNPQQLKDIGVRGSVTSITATKAKFQRQGTSALFGNVVVKQPDRELTAERAYLYRDAKTNKVNRIELYGNVHVREKGKLLVGTHAHLRLDKNEGTVENAVYRIAQKHDQGQVVKNNQGVWQRIYAKINAWGRALKAVQVSKGLYKFFQATYTTCPPTTCVWKVKASELILNHNTGVGEAYNARVYVRGVPVFYSPYLNFPIDNRRKTGFLNPTYGTSQQTGTAIAVPFYWNMAPNYDDTITPNYFNLRGLRLDNLFRYLTPTSHGQLYTTYLPNDRDFIIFRNSFRGSERALERPADFRILQRDTAQRGFVSYQNKSHFYPHWSFDVNYNYASDTYYFQNFPRYKQIPIDQLPEYGNLYYATRYSHTRLSFYTYQTMNTINEEPLASPYSHKPEFDFNYLHPFGLFGLTYGLRLQAVNFTNSNFPGENRLIALGLKDPVTTGQRYVLRPSISYPITEPGYYLRPRLQADLAYYHLVNQEPGFENNPSRALPMFDLLGKLNFERYETVFGHTYIQTLEPEIYYLYVPFKNQTAIPIFDTSQPILSVPQMLHDNRFAGNDRMGDANQVTLALTTRMLNPTDGTERFKAQVADIVYFTRRKVNLCQPSLFGEPGNNCPRSDGNPLSTTNSFSPLVGSVSYHLLPYWTIYANLTWQLGDSTPLAQGASIHYQTDDQHIFNLGYNFLQFEVPQTVGGVQINRITQVLGPNPRLGTVSLVWPLPFWHNWAFLGYSDYDIRFKRFVGNAVGIQFDSCCWGFRFVLSRTLLFERELSTVRDERNEFNNAVYLQIIFKGLGVFGNHDPSSLLTSNISGFQDSYRNPIPDFF